MWIDNHHYTATLLADFFIHLGNLFICKVLRIELKVLITLRIVVLLCPLYVGPQVVDWEAVVREIAIPIYHHLS
jgi:hypothetical protein